MCSVLSHNKKTSRFGEVCFVRIFVNYADSSDTSPRYRRHNNRRGSDLRRIASCDSYYNKCFIDGVVVNTSIKKLDPDFHRDDQSVKSLQICIESCLISRDNS